MNKKVMTLIISLCTFIFTDIEFNKLITYLRTKLYNSARLYVEEKLELLEATLILFMEDSIIEEQIKKCRRLDDIVTDIYINNLVVA